MIARLAIVLAMWPAPRYSIIGHGEAEQRTEAYAFAHARIAADEDADRKCREHHDCGFEPEDVVLRVCVPIEDGWTRCTVEVGGACSRPRE